MILYREKTQIRLCINITDTVKREKMLHIRPKDGPAKTFFGLKKWSWQTDRTAADGLVW